MWGRRAWLVDGLVGVVLVAPVASNQGSRGDWLGAVAAVAVMALAMVVARRVPVVGVVVVVVGTFFDGNFVFSVPVLCYLAGLRTERVRPVVAGFLGIVAVGAGVNGLLRTEPAQLFTLVMLLLLIGIFPWLLGRYRAQQGRLVSAGWERAARLEYERRMIVRQAELRERARIAQEMHDRLGHELSLIALGAGALETTPDLPDRQRVAAGRIRQTAATATEQLREIISVLGEEMPLASVESLVARARESGMAITVRVVGPAGEVPPAVERTSARIVREALTNAGRHAPGAAVAVEVEHRPGRTLVEVVNAAADHPTTGATAGIGLVGLHERARLLGGTLSAAATADGGFRVAAELPHHGRPAPAEEVPAETELRSARRRARRSLATAVLIPAGLAASAAVGYYAVAVSGTELGEAAFDGLVPGTPRAELAGALPRRQAWQRPADDRCEFYSDGNFPLAEATYRLCFADGRLVTKERLR